MYLRLLIFLPAILTPACASSSLAFHMMYSAYKLNEQGINKQSCHTPFPILNQWISCSILRSHCWFLTHIQISQETGNVVRYSHLFKNFPQFVVIHTVKGFSIVNEAEVEFFFLEFSYFMIQWMSAIWSLVPLLFINPTCTSGISQFTYCWRLAQRFWA